MSINKGEEPALPLNIIKREAGLEKCIQTHPKIEPRPKYLINIYKNEKAKLVVWLLSCAESLLRLVCAKRAKSGIFHIKTTPKNGLLQQMDIIFSRYGEPREARTHSYGLRQQQHQADSADTQESPSF